MPFCSLLIGSDQCERLFSQLRAFITGNSNWTFLQFLHVCRRWAHQADLQAKLGLKIGPFVSKKGYDKHMHVSSSVITQSTASPAATEQIATLFRERVSAVQQLVRLAGMENVLRGANCWDMPPVQQFDELQAGELDEPEDEQDEHHSQTLRSEPGIASVEPDSHQSASDRAAVADESTSVSTSSSSLDIKIAIDLPSAVDQYNADRQIFSITGRLSVDMNLSGLHRALSGNTQSAKVPKGPDKDYLMFNGSLTHKHTLITLMQADQLVKLKQGVIESKCSLLLPFDVTMKRVMVFGLDRRISLRSCTATKGCAFNFCKLVLCFCWKFARK